MKKILYISFIALICGCTSLLKNDEQENAIERQTEQAIIAINNAEEHAVSDAKTKIDEIITNAIGKADDTLKNAIESAQATIKTNVSKEINSQKEELKKDMTRETRKAKIVGLIGILFGFVGFAFALYALFKKQSSNRESLSSTTLVEKLKDVRVRNELEKIMLNSTILTNSVAKEVQKCGYATKKELNEIKSKIGVKTGHYDATYRQAASLSKPVQTGDSGGGKEQNAIDGDTKMGTTIHEASSTYELYANDTNTMAISEIYEKYQPGSSIYRLILDRPDSNVAVIELCTDHDDAKRRITKNDDSLLSSICDIRRISEDPKEVIILDKGTVERVGKSEWKVVKKIIVELR